MKYIGIIALAGLGACTFNPETMFYQVTQRSANGVSIQMNKGNMKSESPEVAQMLAHMDKMAVGECQGSGKSGASVTSERNYTTGPYYSWIERTYSCQ